MAAAAAGVPPDAFHLSNLRAAEELISCAAGAGNKASTVRMYDTWHAYQECFILFVTDIMITAHGGNIESAFPTGTPMAAFRRDRETVQRWGGKFDKETDSWIIEPDPSWHEPFSLEMNGLFIKYFTRPLSEDILPGFGTPVYGRFLKQSSVEWAVKAYGHMLRTFGRAQDNPAKVLDGRGIANHPSIKLIFAQAYKQETAESTARATCVSAAHFDIEKGLPILRDIIFDNNVGPFINQPVKQAYVWMLVTGAVRLGWRTGDMGKIPAASGMLGTNWVRARDARCARRRPTSHRIPSVGSVRVVARALERMRARP